MDWCGISITVALMILALIIYIFFEQRYRYFKRKRIAFVQPIFPYGNLNEVGTKIPISTFTKRVYDKFKGDNQVDGLFLFFKPALLVLDIHLVKNILIRDFNNFNDRGMYYNEVDDPLSAHLFSLEANKWKVLRSKLTPAFTSGKMKFMFPTIAKIAERLRWCLGEQIRKDGEVIEIRDIISRFTTDVIGTCAFGIECNSLNNPDAEFHKMSRMAFECPRHNTLIQNFLIVCKSLGHLLRIKSIRDDVATFFWSILVETIDYRERNNVERNDFMDIMIKLKNCAEHKVTMKDIAAQGYVFFLAGYETTASTLTFALYELALNSDVQKRAREEIRRVLEMHDGQFSYEAISEMTLLGQVINETLRKYPPAVVLTREALNGYTISDTKHVIERGTICFIPVYAIHHDPEYYPEPEKFRPERFAPETVSKRDPLKWLPFGVGPRNCIGLRFAMMQIRLSLATLLANFEFSTTDKTIVPITFVPQNFMLTPNDGVYLNVRNLKC